MKKSIYLITAILGVLAFNSCKKDNSSPSNSSPSNSNNNNNSNTITINSTPQFSGTINGTAYSLVNGATYNSGVASNKQIGSPSTGSYSSLIGNNNTNQPYFTINKGTLTFSNSMPDSTLYDSFFPLGNYSYSINYANGIEIDWIDPSGNLYTTSMGSGNQTGSTFNVSAKQVSTILGYYNVKIIATFSCKLYNSNGGSIALTNGTYVGYFEND